MVQRGFWYLLQLVVVLISLFVARELTEMFWLVPGALRKQSPIDDATLLTMAGYFLASHVVLLAVVQWLNRLAPFASFRRATIEFYAAMVATSLAASAIFLFTTVPFSANYFAWVYVLVALGYVILYGAYRLLASSGEEVDERSWWGLVFSPWTAVVGVLVISPGILAGLYKANQDFSNSVNDLRASLNISVDANWALEPAYPGQLFEQPMMVAAEPRRDDAIIVLSRPGRLFRYVTAPDWQEEVLLDLSDEVDSVEIEMGAYSFVLHPDYGEAGSERSGLAYLYYTHVDGDRHFNRLVRFDLSLPTREAREGSRQVLMDLERLASGMHNGGGMFFGPDDGFLYLAFGDYMMPEGTQRIDERLLGGIVRIDVDQQGEGVSTPIKRQPEGGVTQHYHIPVDNPWYGEENALEEYWALGFRNPWRMSMDPETGSIWLGDVGVNLYEEQNRVEMGDNGMWNYREGPVETDVDERGPIVGRAIEPIYYYKQTALARAATGGLVYRGQKHEELVGWYLFADNQAGTIHALDPDDPMNSARIIAKGGQFGQLGITGIQTDAAGEIYVSLLGAKDRPSGEIVRLVAKDEDGVPAAEDGIPVASADAAAEVETKYLSVCSRCHGGDGGGAPEMDLGEDAAPRPDFRAAAWQEQVTDDHLRQVIVEGGAAVGLSEQMPAWEGFFTEEELDLLVAKLRGFAKELAPSTTTSPAS